MFSHGTEWPILCWCAVKQTTHSLCLALCVVVFNVLKIFGISDIKLTVWDDTQQLIANLLCRRRRNETVLLRSVGSVNWLKTETDRSLIEILLKPPTSGVWTGVCVRCTSTVGGTPPTYNWLFCSWSWSVVKATGVTYVPLSTVRDALNNATRQWCAVGTWRRV